MAKSKSAKGSLFKWLFYTAVLLTFVKEVVVPAVLIIGAPRLISRLIRGDAQVGWARVSFDGQLLLSNTSLSSRSKPGSPFFKGGTVGLDVNFISLAKGELLFSNLLIKDAEFLVECDAQGAWNFTEFFEAADGALAKGDGPTMTFAEFPLEQVRLKNCTIVFRKIGEAGSVTEFRAERINAKLIKEGAALKLKDSLEGVVASGKLTATEAFIAPSDKTAFEFQFNLDKCDIATLLSDTPFAGKATKGQLTSYLTLSRNMETGFVTVGAGYFDVYEADLWQLPFFLGVLNVLDFAMPGSPTIDEARLKYEIHQSKFKINDMALLSHAISLIGEGSVDLDGNNLDMVFVHRFGKEGFGQLPIFGGAIQGLVDFIQGNINQIEVHGTISEPDIRIVPLKLISKPISTIHDIFSGD